MSETDNLIDTMAKLIVGTVDNRLSSADFDKSSQGVVTAKAGDTYTIAVFGGNYNITTDQTFVVGQKVLVTAPQGNMKNLTVSPGNIGTMKTVQSGVQDVDDRLSDIEGDYNFAYDIIKKQAQTDGELTIWYNVGTPTANGYPAYQWKTDDAKKGHVGDMCFDTKNNVVWQWEYKNNTYQWIKVSDSTITATLLKSSKAQDTADGKRRVFYSDKNHTPSTPYDVGDIWAQGENGDLLRCIKARTIMESSNKTDWALASKYTDDTVANNVKQDLKDFKDGEFTNLKTTYKTYTEVTDEHIKNVAEAILSGADLNGKETLIKSNQTSIEQTSSKISLIASETDLAKAQETGKSALEITKESIKSEVVGKNQFTGKNLISTINQTAEAVTIDADKINLNGLVTIENKKATGFNSDAVNKSVTSISGDVITTGTLKADRIIANSITSDKIQSGAIMNEVKDFPVNQPNSGGEISFDDIGYSELLLVFRGWYEQDVRKRERGTHEVYYGEDVNPYYDATKVTMTHYVSTTTIVVPANIEKETWYQVVFDYPKAYIWNSYEYDGWWDTDKYGSSITDYEPDPGKTHLDGYDKNGFKFSYKIQGAMRCFSVRKSGGKIYVKFVNAAFTGESGWWVFKDESITYDSKYAVPWKIYAIK